MRIIAGEFRGRKLLPPRGRVTRPITSRTKTALFNILGQAVRGAVVADLFAGTGTIGLEALSRGASRCCFAERDPDSLSRLRRNVEAMGLGGRCRIWGGDIFGVLRARLAALDEPIDLAFLDPPYRLTGNWRWEEAVERLLGPLGRHLASDGAAILRCERNLHVPQALGPLRVHQRRDYGKMSLVFLSLTEPPERPPDDGHAGTGRSADG